MAVVMAVAALALLPQRFHLAFVGRGYERVAHELTREPVRGRVHHGIALAPDAIVPAIRSADVGLVIYGAYSENYRNALPNGFFQVVAAGLPVVRMPLPEIEATVGRSDIGVCLDCPDAPSLAQAILDCADDDVRYRAGAATLARELSWTAEATRLRCLVDALFAERGSAPARYDCSHAAAAVGAERSCAE